MGNWFTGLFSSSEKRSSNLVSSISDIEQHFLRSLGIEPISVAVSAKSAMGISTFYACVRLISDLIAAQPFSVYKSLEGGGSVVGSDHKLHYLLHTRPNARMSSFIFRRTMLANMLVYGFSIAQIVKNGLGEPIALIPYASKDIDIYEDPQTGYLFFHVIGKPNLIFSEDDVIHLKDLGFDGNKGSSIVNFQKKTLKLDMLASGFAEKYYENGTYIAGFLTTPLDAKNEEAAKEYKRRVLDAIKGDGHGGRGLAVLGAGVDYKSVGKDPVESDLIKLLERSDKDISKAFGIPLAMLGDTEKQTSFGTGVEQSFIGVTNTVIIPKIVQLEQEIDYKCFTRSEINKGYYTKINLRNLLRGDAKSYAEYVAKLIQNGVYNQDEVRSWDELPPIKGGSTNWIQQNMMPIDQAKEILNSKSNGKGAKVPAGSQSNN